MGIDWGLVTKVAVPLATLLVGAILTRVLSRAVVTTYISHVSSHRQAADAGGQPFDVFTHSVVIKNNGWASAKNVRLTHNFLPSFSVFPDIEYQVSDLPGGGREIRFPLLVQDEQVTVSYLYFPPVTWDQINRLVKSDEGLANVIRVIPMRQYPQWFNKLVAVLLFAGTISMLYVLVVLVRWLVPLVSG